MKTGKMALITGASAGIGKELARQHAAAGGNMIIVARRLERLHELKEELEEKYGINVYPIAGDLSKPDTPEQIFNQLNALGLSIDYLINNAGFSQQGYFDEVEWEIHENMIMVDVMAMVKMCHLFLPSMRKRNQGRIMNVASSAAFAPGGPLQSIYYASKSFMLSFSQGLAGELTNTAITVTTLCPGATHTEFEKVSGLDETNLFAMEKAFSAEEVARDGYKAMLNGEMKKLTALTPINKFLLKNMNLFPAKKILQQIKLRQEKVQ